MLLVMVGLFVQAPILQSPARAGGSSDVISSFPVTDSNSGALLSTKFEGAPNWILCDRPTVWGLKIERRNFAKDCQDPWRSADLKLVLCAGKSLYSGYVSVRTCPAGRNPVVVDPDIPSMKCDIIALTRWLCSSPARLQAPIPTTVPATASPTTSTPPLPAAGTFCSEKLFDKSDKELTMPFENDGILGSSGKVPAWDDFNIRCVSAEILSRLQSKWMKGKDTSSSPCVPREKDQSFFPPPSVDVAQSWFFGEIKSQCQGIKRVVRNCPGAKNKNEIWNGDKGAIINAECTYSPDGRLVVENLAPVWTVNSKKIQVLEHSPGIGVYGFQKETNSHNRLEGMQAELPLNGCITQKKISSDCVADNNPLVVKPEQEAIIEKANQLLGAIYGKTPGLAGINEGLTLGKQKITFDCVSLARAVGATKETGTANAIYKKAKLFEWGNLKVKNMTWKEIGIALPIGSLISTSTHLTVVVGYLERQSGGFLPIVVEAENNLSGVVRAKVEDTDKFIDAKKPVKVFLP